MLLHATNINFSRSGPLNNIRFKGIETSSKTSKPDYLLAFDLDGTLLNCSKKDIENIVQIAQNKNCKLAYISGRLSNELETARKEYAKKGIDIPLPDYFVSNNGQFIHEKINGKLQAIPSEEWNSIIAAKNFDRNAVKNAMKDFISENMIDSRPALLQFDYRPSDFNIEYLVDVKYKDIVKNKVARHLEKHGMQPRLISDYVPPEDVNKGLSKLPGPVQDKIRPMLDKDGGIYALHITAVNKADAVDFIRNKLEIKKNQVITAGNGGNDLSMAARGYWFILVKNAQKILKELIQNLSQERVIKATKDGAAGISEALTDIFTRQN